MSLNCRVFRDEKGQIDFVNAPNGNRSKLFDTLVNIAGGNKNTALNIYALTETEDLKDAVKAKVNSFKERFKNIVKVAPSYSNMNSPVEEVRFSKTSNTSGYFSNALSAINNLADKNPKNTQGWIKQLTDVQKNGGVKNVNQELQWIGLEDYLNDYVKENNPKAGNIPSSVVEDYIKSNQIEIVEVSKGTASDDMSKPEVRDEFYNEAREQLARIDMLDQDAEETLDIWSANPTSENFQVVESLLNYANIDLSYIYDKNSNELDNATKYSGYQLKGGENYREVLLTMPSKVIENNKIFTVKNRKDFWKDLSNFSAQEVEEGFVVSSVRGGRQLIEKDYYIKTKEDAINAYREDNLQLLDIFSEEQGVEDYDFYDENGEYFNTTTAPNIGQAISEYKSQTSTKEDEYKSSHWSEGNILAHVRLNEKTLPDGRKVLIVNEIQSDWAQDGRKKGFKDPVKEAQREELRLKIQVEKDKVRAIESELENLKPLTNEEKFELNQQKLKLEEARNNVRNNRDWDALGEEITKIDDKLDDYENTKNRLKSDIYTLKYEGDGAQAALEEELSNFDEQNRDLFNKVQEMPYKNTDQWVGLATRRILQMAAQEGYDGVSFATGQQSADMYSLSKQVDEISAIQDMDNGQNIGTYTIYGLKDDKTVFSQYKIPENKLESYLGKELAKNIIEENKKNPDFPKTSFKGEELEVGGEGMKTFYDSIVTKVAQKEAQRFDKNAKLDSIDFGFSARQDVSVTTLEDGYTLTLNGDFVEYVDKDTLRNANLTADKNGAEQYFSKYLPQVVGADKLALARQPFIAITDKMRSELGKAIPLFSKTQGQEAPREVLDEITDRLKQSGLANNVYKMTNAEIESKLVELGYSNVTQSKSTKKDTRLKVIKEALKIDKYTPELEVASYFLSGGRVSEESIKKLYKNSKGEVKARMSLISKTAPSISQIAHNLWQNSEIKDNEGNSTYTDQDYVNFIEDLLNSNNTRKSIAEEVLKPYQLENNIPEEDYLYLLSDEYIESQIAERESAGNLEFSKIDLTTAGFTYKGDVYLNTDAMGLDTPIHEFGHLHLDWLKENRNDLYQAGLSIIGKNKKEAQKYIDIVKETQPDLEEGSEKFNNEVLAQVIGDQGARLVNSKKEGSIADWLKNVWEAIKDILGLSSYTAEQVANMTLAEFGTASAAEMLSGKVVDINSKVSEYLNRINTIKEKEPSNYWSVDVPSIDVVRDAVINERLVEVEGGMGIVTQDGNMIGLFKDNPNAKNVAKELQEMRVEKGGIKMDNYDGYLTKIYQKNGFRVVSRLAFNEEYAPEDWNKEKHGTPDVVFMIYDPNNTLNIEEKSFTSDQYDEASDYRDSFVEEAKKIHPYYSKKLSENKTGKTQSFFSDVVRGDSDKYKAKKQWVPLLKYTKEQNDFNSLYSKFKGNFDNHIATSIPTFRETQVKVGTALAKMFGEKGGLIYDIGGSEGGFIKAITESTKGKVKSINLDVNEDMGEAHKKNPVKGSDFINEAFYEGYQDEDTGKMYPKHKPKVKADVVHESMVFQFITPERAQFIKEIKDNYLKEDGLVLLEEKLVPESDQEWLQNEYIKDQYKLQYYSQEEISGKAEEVLAGMRKNQTSVKDLQDALSSNFKYVEQYWDSGNFKGFVATNNIESLNKFRENFGSNVVFKGDTSEVSKSVKRQPSLELNGTRIFAKERVNPITGENMGDIEWELIESTERGKGNARKAAELFLNGTDAQGKDVYLAISPRDNETSPEKLESFYSSLGFEKISDFEMTRKARPITPKDIDSNGEVSVKALMDFSNSKVKPLGLEGLKAAKNAAMALKVKSSAELIEKMEKALMKNGIVLFDKLSLQRSKLYNTFEINTIVNSPSLQKQIKNSLLALKNSEPFEIDYNENFIVPQGREVNQFGKQEVLNPNTVEKDLIESVAGLLEDEIDEALPAAFSNKYYTDSDFRETVDSIARDYKRAPIKEVIDGELVDKTEDVKGMLTNTLTEDSNEGIAEDIMFLREEIDEDIFNSNLTKVSKILNKIKKNAYINGIDLRNLPTLALELSREKVLGFLDSMEDMLEDPYNQEAFDEFSDRYYEILGEKEPKTEVIKSNSQNDVFVEEPLSEYEMFSRFRLVKKQDNIYRQVTETPLENLYENFFEHKNLLPEGVESIDNLKAYVQKSAASLEVSDYEVDVDNLEKIFLYKKFFGFPMTTVKPRVSTEGFNKLTNSEEYLTEDFVKEFNKWLLATGNTYFKVTNKGVELTEKDELSKAEAIDSVPVRFRQDLSEYNIVSNNLNLNLPLEEEQYRDVNTQYEERQKAVNNPDSIKKIAGQYTYLKDGVLAVKNESETFVKTPIGVFEKIFEFANIKFYGKLDTDTNRGYKKIVVEAPFSDINFNDYMYLENKPEAFKDSKNYYSRKELEDINKDYFECQ